MIQENRYIKICPASYRDPDGFIFYDQGEVFRALNISFKDDYDHFMSSGLYNILIDRKLLIPHDEINNDIRLSNGQYKIIKPIKIPFISYPYEWCFSQLKDAALLTLEIQKIALEYGMTLKDGSAYNVQYFKGKPIFIDTLSFGKYQDGEPWVGYRQFCQHFLAPLVLMCKKDIRLNQLLRIYIDGIPLDLVSKILPFNTRLKLNTLLHIHIHARSQKHFSTRKVKIDKYRISKNKLISLISSLSSFVKSLQWKPGGTEWSNYSKEHNYSNDALNHKVQIVSQFLDSIKPKEVFDLGANIGVFSRIASNKGALTISFDIDYSAVEKNYLECRKRGDENILPLVLDLTNPSPAIGWFNQERLSFAERARGDMVLALALIHHLAISNNLPFEKISRFFKNMCKFLVIEFIPKNDSQVQKLLATRKDIFSNYSKDHFEDIFRKSFKILDCLNIKHSVRFIYLMERND